MKSFLKALNDCPEEAFLLYLKEEKIFHDKEFHKALSLDDAEKIGRRLCYYYRWCQRNERDYAFDLFLFSRDSNPDEFNDSEESELVHFRQVILERISQGVIEVKFGPARPLGESSFIKNLSILDNVKEPVLITESEPFDSPGPRVIYSNKSFTDLTGYSAHEIMGKSPRLLQSGNREESKEARENIKEGLEKWSTFTQQVKNYKKCGDPFIVELNISPVADETGWWTHWVSFQKDVTKHRLDALAYEKIQDLSKVGFWRLNPRTNEVYQSQGIHNIFGVQEGDINYAEEGFEYFIGEDKKRIETCVVNCVEKHIPYDETFEFKDALGNHKWVRAVGQPLLDEAGGLIEIYGTFHDITRFVQNELEIQNILDNTPDIIYRLTPAGHFDFVSRSWKSLLGHETSEVIGKHFKEFIHPEDVMKCDAELQSLVNGTKEETTVEYRVISKDGRIRVHRTNGIFINEGEPYFQAISSDITDLQELKEELHTILKATNVGLWNWNIPKNELVWDDSMYELFEVEKEDFSGAFDAWENTLHPDYRESAVKAVTDVLESGTEFQTEFLIQTKDGREKKIFATGVLERNAEGKPLVLKGLNLDKTPEYLREKELEVQKHKSIVQSRLAALGELACGVGHEINNPLAIAMGSLKYFIKNSQVENNELLNNVMMALERIKNITKGLKTLSHHESNKEAFNLVEAVEESFSFVKGVYHDKGVDVSFTNETEENYMILGSRSEIQQVVLNLLSNAFDATEGIDNRKIEVVLSLKEGRDQGGESNRVLLEIKDNGKGISSEIADKVYDSFYTTKEVGKGSGIGLSISKSIIESNGGTIDFRSKVNKGTSFFLEFERYNSNEKSNTTNEVPPENSAKEDQRQEKFRAKILVIDDEEGILKLLKYTFEDFGFECITTTNGDEGLKLLKERDDFDVVISDIKMPNSSGVEIVKKASQLKLKKKPFFFLITGGVNDDDGEEEEVSPLISGLFYKPFEEEEIISRICEVMGINE